MLAEMRQYVQLFEDRGFDRLVLSAKTSDALRTIEVNRRIAETFRYPIHLGLTHAGLPEDARIPSAIALGTLLAEGIGDTIRVSAAGDPVIETQMAVEILISLGLRERRRPELVVCPTCGRTEIDVVKLAHQVRGGSGQDGEALPRGGDGLRRQRSRRGGGRRFRHLCGQGQGVLLSQRPEDRHGAGGPDHPETARSIDRAVIRIEQEE